MANANAPQGFRPYGDLLRARPYTAASSAVYPGDAVKLTSGGLCDVAAAGDELLGVALTYAAASGEVMVSDHPDQLYTAQCHGSAVDAQTDYGNVADILATSPDTTYKKSKHEVDDSTLANGSSAQLMILGLDRSVNNALGANAQVVCRINEHLFGDSNNGV